MSGFFSYDSRLMQALNVLGDLILLNILFLLCSLPLVTIGAAQGALYSGLRTLRDPEDDSSCIKAFFRGLRTGFGRVTAAWLIFAVPLCAALWILLSQSAGSLTGSPALLVCVVSLLLAMLFQTQLPLIHAHFDCTIRQLLRNSVFYTISQLPRAFVSTVLLWLPVGVALFDLSLFLKLSPLWLCIYYSAALSLSLSLMKKPLQILIAQFRPTPDDAPEEP